MRPFVKWALCALILLPLMVGCGTAPSSSLPPRVVRLCPPVAPLDDSFRLQLVAALEAAAPPHDAVIRRALAEWRALRDQARVCAQIADFKG